MLYLKKLDRSGQHIIEYSLLIILVIAGVIVMGPYLKRSWDGQMRGWEVAVKDTMTDTIKEAPAFSFEECECSYVEVNCVFDPNDPNFLKVRKDISCNFTGCDVSLGLPATIYEDGTPGQCCYTEATGNCGLDALVSNGGHMSTGCNPEVMEVYKRCNDLPDVYECCSSATYMYRNTSTGFADGQICPGNTHEDCRLGCKWGQDEVTDPEATQYTTGLYGGFCEGSALGAPAGTNVIAIENGTCGDHIEEKCILQCAPVAVPAGHRCECPDGMNYNTTTGGCDCSEGYVYVGDCEPENGVPTCFQGSCLEGQCLGSIYGN